MRAAAAVLIGAGVTLDLLCAVAIVAARDAFDRLHFVGPASVVATIPIAVGIALTATSAPHVAKVAVTGLFVWLTSPFLSRALARALRIREAGELASRRDEVVGSEGDG